MKLHELNIAGKHIFNCPKIEVTELVMIYYKPKECGLEFCDDKNGFDFCVVQTESYPIDHEDIMSYSHEEWVQELLMTLCGAEWFVEEV